MKRVVERCPNCGVEHDDARGGECEVCGTPLRFWCRVHGAEAGWLDTAECPRCAAELAARRSAPPPPLADSPAPRRAPVEAAPPPRRVRVGPRRPPPEWAGAPPAPGPAYAERDPRDVLRESAEELRPYAAAGAGAAWRLVRAVLAVVRSVILWGLLGLLGGGAYAYSQGGDPVWTALFGAMVGGGIGLFLGLFAALRILFAGPARRVR